SETPIAKAVGVLFCPQESAGKTSSRLDRNHWGNPSEMTARFLVWCSSFFNGLMSRPRIGAHFLSKSGCRNA
ncbi:hypothetical protein QLG12_14180, partial [Pseudomonas sp. V88_4]|uniref:hypothetical protein n=1 Tax=Pseudomonas sp. V88_4 TaxID=3044229 RepID=UPI00249E0B5B